MERYLTEAVGTFFLVLTIGLTAVGGAGAFAPIAIGATLMVMVYMGGHVSGAHYNPAVSVAVLLRGQLEARELVPYIGAQIFGALLAGVAVFVATGSTFAPAPAPDASLAGVAILEFLFTFALALVVLNVATHPATEGNTTGRPSDSPSPPGRSRPDPCRGARSTLRSAWARFCSTRSSGRGAWWTSGSTSWCRPWAAWSRRCSSECRTRASAAADAPTTTHGWAA